MLWQSALFDCQRFVATGIRALQWGTANVACQDPTASDYPTPWDALLSARALATTAAIGLLTIFNRGRPAVGVAANLDTKVKDYRELCLRTAYPTPEARAEFDSFIARLKAARDGLIAHADADAQQFEQTGATVTSFRPTEAEVTPRDLEAIGAHVDRLLSAVTNLCPV